MALTIPLKHAPVVCVAFLGVTLLGPACATGDSDRKSIPSARYDVALALVHEAEAAAVGGDAQRQDLKYREALHEMLEAEKGGVLNSEQHYLMAVIYFAGFRRHAEAKENLEDAIRARRQEAKEDYPEADQLLGVVLVDEGHPEAALAYFDHARQNLLYTTPYYSEQEMGFALFRLGRHDEAVAHLERALRAQPDLCGAYVKLAEVHEARGDDVAVQRVLGNFLKRCDTDRLRPSLGSRYISAALLQLARSQLRSGEKQLAFDVLRRCAGRFPEEQTGEACAEMLRAAGEPLAVPSAVDSGGSLAPPPPEPSE